MAYRTARAVTLKLWDNIGAPTIATIPAGAVARWVPGLDGLKGAGFAVDSVELLTELTGNAHDSVHRYAVLPPYAVEGESEAERAELVRVRLAWAGTIGALFSSAFVGFRLPPADAQALASMPTDSTCGDDCRRAIEAGEALALAIYAAHGDFPQARADRDAIARTVAGVCVTFICG